MACWAVCWAAAALGVAEAAAARAPAAPTMPGEDIAWVWDHQAPPLRAQAWAVTVTQLQLTSERLVERPRLRALPPAGQRRVTPVVHVEQAPRVPAAALNESQQAAIAARVLAAARSSSSGWVQLDFEARPAQRDSYQALVARIRRELPGTHKLSVTLLAWQCRSAAWIRPLAADELVPMFFRMGRETPLWLAQIQEGATDLQPRCRQEAAGFAPTLTPPAPWQAQWPRRYWFNLAPGGRTTWVDTLEFAVWPSP